MRWAVCLDLDLGDDDRDGRRRIGIAGERLRRGDILARLELGGELLRKDVGDRLRSGERDLTRLDARLRLLVRPRRELSL
jgi:GAF domain-containing protein